MTGYFDVPMERKMLWCHICRRDTPHDRPSNGSKALFTCRDPKHPHPTREQQEAGMCLPKPSPADEMKRAAQLHPSTIVTVKK